MSYWKNGGSIYEGSATAAPAALNEFEAFMTELLSEDGLSFYDAPTAANLAFRKRLAEIAEGEYARWKEAFIVEAQSKNSAADNLIAHQALLDYHLEGLSTYQKSGTAILSYNATRAEAQVKDIQTGLDHKTSYWSAAFISYCVRKAVNGREAQIPFKYSSAHVWYVREAKKSRDENRTDYPFKAYNFDELKLETGDILCNGRSGSGSLTYSGIGKSGDSEMHCDIVTSVDYNAGYACAIGGNTHDQVSTLRSDTVGKKVIRLNADGKVIQRRKEKYVAVIKYEGNA